MKTRAKPNKILVIEDEPEVLNLTSRVLELEGYHVFRASDGAVALEMLRTNAIDLLLLDLQLPVYDGWTILRKIRSHPVLAALSVVIFTASAAVSKREEAFNLGAAAYLVKPVNVPELICTVRNILCTNRKIGGSHVIAEAVCVGS